MELGVVEHTFNLRTQKAEANHHLYELKASLVYMTAKDPQKNRLENPPKK